MPNDTRFVDKGVRGYTRSKITSYFISLLEEIHEFLSVCFDRQENKSKVVEKSILKIESLAPKQLQAFFSPSQENWQNRRKDCICQDARLFMMDRNVNYSVEYHN